MNQKTQAPYFSVITPSWNQGGYLSTCIESVLAQKDPGFEHLVFDNCSTDSTRAVAARYPHIRLVSEPDRGQSHAVNKGLQAACGEVVCWLNTDDAYPSGLFARLRDLFKDPSCDVVFGDAEQVAYDGSPSRRVPAVLLNRLDLVKWWTSEARMHQPAVFFRRRVAAEMGPLREDLHYAMDYEYWWRLSGKFRFNYVPEVFAIQHRQPESKTVLAWHKVYEERERIFTPHYGLVDGGNREALLREKRHGLAHRHLMNAFAAASVDKKAARSELARAWAQSPSQVIKPRTLGLLRRLMISSWC
ncbi:MAG: glycosyltransferase [Chthoniobacterales bacterium]|nr:glycosyltransferase [Chthoniobacterales bacterium]